MKLPFGIEIRRSDRVGDLAKRLDTLESQAVRVTDLRQMAAQASGAISTTAAGDATFPFGPLSPLRTMGTPREQALGPRRWQYPVGANIQYTPRTGENVSFAELRNFARLYDIARICIQVRKEELQGLEWSIVAREKGREDEFAVDIADETRFWEKPDRKNTFDDWLGLLLEDILVVDAMTLHKQTNRKGDLFALRAVAGDTIHPVIDEIGEIYGYQQIIYGIPRTAYVDPDYARAMSGEGNPLFPDLDKVKDVFPIQQLIYRPRVLMPDSLYGFPPTEWIVVTINQALRKQVADLKYYTDGNIPDVMLPMPDGTTIDQTMQFQQDFDALLKGNAQERFGMLHFLPGGIDPSKAREFRKFTVETTWDEMLLKKTCAAYGISPQEIGFTAQINKATGEMQENAQNRRAVEPTTQFFESLFSDIIANDHRRPHLKFSFHVAGAEEDVLKTAQADDIAIKNGSRTIDEVRSVRQYGKPFGINRPFVMTTTGPVYLDQALQKPPTADGQPTTDANTQSPADDELPATTAETQSQSAPSADSRPLNADSEVKKSLAQWRENSLKRIKAGKRPRTDFGSDAIHPTLHAAIAGALEKTTTAAEVKAVFDALDVNDAPHLAKAHSDLWTGYP